MGESMNSLGMWLAIFGVGSFLLNQIGMEFILLSWIDNWGIDTGNIIRVAMTVVGGGVWVATRNEASSEGAE